MANRMTVNPTATQPKQAEQSPPLHLDTEVNPASPPAAPALALRIFSLSFFNCSLPPDYWITVTDFPVANGSSAAALLALPAWHA